MWIKHKTKRVYKPTDKTVDELLDKLGDGTELINREILRAVRLEVKGLSDNNKRIFHKKLEDRFGYYLEMEG